MMLDDARDATLDAGVMLDGARHATSTTCPVLVTVHGLVGFGLVLQDKAPTTFPSLRQPAST